MTRANRRELERKLEQARRLAMEPTDPLTRERLAQLIEELEFQLRDPRKVAYVSQTTLSVDETRAIINRLRERFPGIVGPRTDDI